MLVTGVVAGITIGLLWMFFAGGRFPGNDFLSCPSARAIDDGVSRQMPSVNISASLEELTMKTWDEAKAKHLFKANLDG